MAKKKKFVPLSRTGLDTWFERDRAHVRLFDVDTDETLLELWDDDVAQAGEDGFLTFGKGDRALHESAYDYYKHLS